ncbi:MAG: hypothetical protein ACHQK9_05780 [Reyranellales bacterium]
MPVRCDVSIPNRIAIGVAEGPVSLRDLEGFLDALEKAGAIGFRKIFDASFGTSTLSDADWLALGTRLGTYLDKRTLGPLAIVATTGTNDELARELAALKSGKRPARVFHSIHEARRWLNTVVPIDA